MQRGRKVGRLNHRHTTAGFEKIHPVIPADLFLDPDPLVKLNQVGAATEKNVLAVIDYFPGTGVLVRRRPAAQVGTLLKSVTRRPLSASAQPAANPARPPPTTATLGDCVQGSVIKPGV